MYGRHFNWLNDTSRVARDVQLMKKEFSIVVMLLLLSIKFSNEVPTFSPSKSWISLKDKSMEVKLTSCLISLGMCLRLVFDKFRMEMSLIVCRIFGDLLIVSRGSRLLRILDTRHAGWMMQIDSFPNRYFAIIRWIVFFDL